MHTQKGLPPYSFISAEAINWAVDTFETINNEADAMKLFKDLHSARHVCHCSKEWKHKFLSGFYLYFVVEKGKDVFEPDQVDLEMFNKDWLEIEMSFKEVIDDPNEPRRTPFHAPYTQSKICSIILLFASNSKPLCVLSV